MRPELCTRHLEGAGRGAEPPVGVAELATVCAQWADLVEERYAPYAGELGAAADPGLVRQGAALPRQLPSSAARWVLLHGDFNPGNVLTATRRPWLAIGPHPVVGDPGWAPLPLIEQVPGELPLPRRLSLTEELTGERPARVAAWALVRTVEYALWSADGGDVEGASGALGPSPRPRRLGRGLSDRGRVLAGQLSAVAAPVTGTDHGKRRSSPVRRCGGSS